MDLSSINNIEQYFGKYIALADPLSSKVLSSGRDPVKVYNKAKDKGIEIPFLLYVPDEDEVNIY